MSFQLKQVPGMGRGLFFSPHERKTIEADDYFLKYAMGITRVDHRQKRLHDILRDK